MVVAAGENGGNNSDNTATATNTVDNSQTVAVAGTYGESNQSGNEATARDGYTDIQGS